MPPHRVPRHQYASGADLVDMSADALRTDLATPGHGCSRNHRATFQRRTPGRFPVRRSTDRPDRNGGRDPPVVRQKRPRSADAPVRAFVSPRQPDRLACQRLCQHAGCSRPSEARSGPGASGASIALANMLATSLAWLSSTCAYARNATEGSACPSERPRRGPGRRPAAAASSPERAAGHAARYSPEWRLGRALLPLGRRDVVRSPSVRGHWFVVPRRRCTWRFGVGVGRAVRAPARPDARHRS